MHSKERGILALGRQLVLGVILLALMSGGCNFQSDSAASAKSPNLKIALIGDSIGADLAKALRNPKFGGPRGVSWAITAQPGAGWGEGEDAQGNWPLDVVQGGTVALRVRAAARRHPSAIVIELGANDALRAAFAMTLNNGTKLAGSLIGTDNIIRSVVKLASALSSCVVLVSPSYDPTSLYGQERQYSVFALQLRTVLLKEASSAPDHRVVVADWAALSSTHRPAGGSSDNWFSPDGLHPNTFGLKALADLIVRTAKSCSS
jgi:lysophospholipase L1-like esterase